MFEQTDIFRNGFEGYINSIGVQTYRYGNATHAFADILTFMNKEKNSFPPNIIMPSFIPAKLYRTVLAYGYSIKFYEINENCRFDINEIINLIDPDTKAIFVIHYFGCPAEIKQVREVADSKNIILIEDCAHVIYGKEDGGKLGTWGDFSIFSPRKMLNLPEGGYLVLNKNFQNFTPSYSRRVNSLYTLFEFLQTRGKYFYLTLTNGNDIFHLSKIPQRGFIDYARIIKSRIKNISLLSSFYSRNIDVKIHIEKRRQNYNYLYNGLKDFSFLKPLYNDLPGMWTPYSLPVIVEKGCRNILQFELSKSGISCGAGWPESPFDKRLKRTSELADNLIEFPIHPFVKINQLKKIIDECGKFEKRILKKNYSGEAATIYKLPLPENSIFFDTPQSSAFNDHSSAEKENKLPAGDVRIKVIKTDAEFDNISAEWEALCQESDCHIFQTFEWQRLWWKYYGGGKKLNLILFYKEKLIGIAPFFIDNKHLFGIRILSRLRLIGSGVERNKSKESVSEYGVSDYLDLIVHRDYEKPVAETLAGYFRKNFSHCDIIQLDETCTNSIIFKFLLPLLNNFNYKYNITRREICPRITVPETMSEYFKQLNPKVRYKLKKALRDCTDESLFTINKVETEYELIKSFQDFVKLHQKRWNRLGLSGLFSDDKYNQFLKDAAHVFLKKGILNFTAVYSNNECVAAECAFKYKNIYYDYLKAFDDQSPLARYRPGKALLLSLIKDAAENNCKTVDLLRGCETYKFEFAEEWHWVYKVTINNPAKGFSFRYFFFSFIMFFAQIKRRAVNELNIMVSQIKNYGISGFVTRYLPAALKKIKNKLFTSVHEHPDNNGHFKKIIPRAGKKFNLNKENQPVSAVSNSLSKIL